MPNREEVLYRDFSARLQPRLLWDGQDGPAMKVMDHRGRVSYRALPSVKPKSGARRLTEAEDNAIARAHRRRQNKMLRGWRPYARR